MILNDQVSEFPIHIRKDHDFQWRISGSHSTDCETPVELEVYVTHQQSGKPWETQVFLIESKMAKNATFTYIHFGIFKNWWLLVGFNYQNQLLPRHFARPKPGFS
jgi:hypothetical protein